MKQCTVYNKNRVCDCLVPSHHHDPIVAFKIHIQDNTPGLQECA